LANSVIVHQKTTSCLAHGEFHDDMTNE